MKTNSSLENRPVKFERSEDQFRLLVEAVQDYAIFLLDRDGYVASWNLGAERIKGYTAAEIIGKHFSVFYPEVDVRSGKPSAELETASRDGRLEDEGWRLRKDGTTFWANVIITAVKDSTGRLIGFGKVTRDFTERVKAQEALRQEVEEKTEAHTKLRTSEAALRELSLHLLRTQDDERRRIARDLHDSLGQYLSVLKMKIDSAARIDQRPELIRQDLGKCAELADDAIKELRTISYLLHPPMLEEVGLKSAIVWYLEGFAGRTDIKTTLSVGPDLKRFPADVELAVFRVLQESLTNVHRHSGSKTAEVNLTLKDNAVVLEVTDQGSGMPGGSLEESDPRFFGVGIRGMKERLRMLGGTLDLSSSGHGTKIVATVPLVNPEVLGLLRRPARE